jgi:hypothetical protein
MQKKIRMGRADGSSIGSVRETGCMQVAREKYRENEGVWNSLGNAIRQLIYFSAATAGAVHRRF